VGVNAGVASISTVSPHPALPPLGGRGTRSVRRSRAEQYWKDSGGGRDCDTRWPGGAQPLRPAQLLLWELHNLSIMLALLYLTNPEGLL
jgi:hypothetical protein